VYTRTKRYGLPEETRQVMDSVSPLQKKPTLKEKVGFCFRSLKLLYQNGMSSSISEKFGAGFGCGRAAGAGGAWRGACWRGCCGAE
jgi:hypothetical protein